MQMSKQYTRLITTLLLTLSTVACSNGSTRPEPQPEPDDAICVVYEGIDGYGVTDKSERKNDFRFRFHTPQGVHSYTIGNDNGAYTLQNILQEGSRFMIKLSDDSACVIGVEPMTPIAEGKVTNVTDSTIDVGAQRYFLSDGVVYTDIKQIAGGAQVTTIGGVQLGDPVKVYDTTPMRIDRTFVASPYTPIVSGQPGVRTLRNFLATALTPVGTTLYVFGGAWNWQDTGSGPHSRMIGLPQEWISFFQMNDADYEYKNPDPAVSYYPFQGYDEYHYAGADCSGFVGWSIYNTLNTEDGQEGYVMSSTKMARTLAEEFGLGTYARDTNFQVGDIVSIKGHVYIVIGRASDGSLLIVHSTVNDGKGSGVQLSSVGPGKALDLAKKYMCRYDTWSSRYEPVVKPAAAYLDFKPENVGRFSWHIGPDGLEDPDGLRSMTAEQILSLLYGK